LGFLTEIHRLFDCSYRLQYSLKYIGLVAGLACRRSSVIIMVMGTLAAAEDRAREVVNLWAAGAAAVGWIPGSTLFLAGGDVKLVNDIAAIFEVRGVSAESVIAAVGASVAGRGVSEFLSLIPIAGWLVKSAVASGVTKALGEGVIRYMKERSPLNGERTTLGVVDPSWPPLGRPTRSPGNKTQDFAGLAGDPTTDDDAKT
jgi:uncharacterized protein (DUF697 family)